MIDTHPIGLPVGVITLATWWPGLDFDFQAATYSLTPALYIDGDTFYAATVTPGSVSLLPGLFADPDTFYAPTVSATYALAPGLYVDADTFYGATISASYSLSTALYDDADVFYGHSVAVQAAALLPSLLANVTAFYAPSVIRGHGYKANIPSDRPTYVSKDWEEVVRAAGPSQNDYAKYRFSNGREFR